jgi:tetratricopeptide (TPR) repeat protein
MAAAKVFLSYAHDDDAHRIKLVKHLAPLIDKGVLQVWHDRQIRPGANWATEIDSRLESADLVLLLVSDSFLSSEYCKGIELKRALERRAQGLAQVVPVILSSCTWQLPPLGDLQALPTDGVPITEAQFPNQLYTAVVKALAEMMAAHGGRTVAESPALTPAPESQPAEPKSLLPSPPLPGWWRRPQPGWLALGVLVLLGGVTLGWLDQVRAGVRDDLRVDRPDLAAQRLERVPQALRMAWLDDVVALHRAGQQSLDDVSRLAQTRRGLLAERPDDADLLYLDAHAGFEAAVQSESLLMLQRAQAQAERAVQLDPKHAAAHSLLGLVADARGESFLAAAHYQTAAELAPDEPPFVGDHARALLDTGRAQQALTLFGSISQRYTLAALERALAQWALGQWAAALESQTHAVERLRRPSLSAVPAEQRYAWKFFPSPGEVVSLNRAEWPCYAALEREVTRALQGEAGVLATPDVCAGNAHFDKVRRLVDADVCRYALPALVRAGQGARGDEARRGVLGQTGECAVLPVAGAASSV